MAPPARLELGSSLSNLTADPQWLRRYATVGLVSLVPVVGMLALVGWQRRVYELAREGDQQTLPPLRLGADIGHGVPVFVALLNLLAPAMVLGAALLVVLGAISSLAAFASPEGQAGAGGAVAVVGMALAYLLVLAAGLGMNLLQPEIQRRGFNGDMMPLLAPGESIRAIRQNPGSYVMVLVSLFLANAIGALGAFACYLGLVVTLPMAMVVMARVIAQWDRVVEDSLYGGAG